MRSAKINSLLNNQSLTTIKIGLLSTIANSHNESAYHASTNVDELMENIRQDLIRLLNTHQQPLPLDNKLNRVAHSIYNYGMPDLSKYDPNSQQDREQARKILQQTIETFEPRLHNLYVSTLLNTNRQAENTLNFRIEAELAIASAKIHVAFDSVVEPANEKIFVYPTRENNHEN